VDIVAEYEKAYGEQQELVAAIDKQRSVVAAEANKLTALKVKTIEVNAVVSSLENSARQIRAQREALEKAMRGFVKAGGREISGAEIFEGTQAIVR